MINIEVAIVKKLENSNLFILIETKVRSASEVSIPTINSLRVCRV